MRQENRYSNGIRLLELVIIVILIGILATLGIHRISAMQTEARQLLVENFAQSLQLAGTMTYMQTSAVGELGNPDYQLVSQGLGQGDSIQVSYGYPAIENTDNLMRLFDQLSGRWHFSTNGEWLNARVDNLSDCAVAYRPPHQPTEQPQVVKQIQGC
ncbi:hypothetical protein [Nitrincola iocasae]|uniref:Type 4 secretion system PilS N-terminal domain-containing protein n=1 Tax=Nitrincola iocasae TaxID=2614693 RepID=A0A5J6LHP0_9GAMM|nr:hypothetical protein [Nitrincola iocasae]QEW08119.1 hypothetical protein F5I99_17365 [Nitrincola iocasae]